jgi:hypothetical protein
VLANMAVVRAVEHTLLLGMVSKSNLVLDGNGSMSYKLLDACAYMAPACLTFCNVCI